MIYVPTGADDVFAIDVETGKQLWVYQAHLEKTISTVCCGWTSRGVAIGEGKIFLGQARRRASLRWISAPGKKCGRCRPSAGRTASPSPARRLYFNGMIISGICRRRTHGSAAAFEAFSAKDGKPLWTFYTVPGPGEVGHESWPQDNSSWQYGGAMVWQTPAVDAKRGLIYFSTGNAAPDFNGSLRKGDNLFSVSIVAIEAKTGKYRWHFQQVHHDLWDYDAPSPVVLFDLEYNGRIREAIAEIGKSGWVYILDRVTGKPLVGIDEMPVPQEPRQNTAATQPFPVGDAVVPHSIDIPPAGFRLVNGGQIFTPYWDQAGGGKAQSLGRHQLASQFLRPAAGISFCLR